MATTRNKANGSSRATAAVERAAEVLARLEGASFTPDLVDASMRVARRVDALMEACDRGDPEDRALVRMGYQAGYHDHAAGL